ncbi:hypothetical protein TPA0910_86170 [Streptomyces hygroscopicus subsp. sporocinereus]|uniref:Transposase n=1 Tax=Streptomyces hygroscopicus TaxID=1912 RepID=A0ABQ3UF44_STRHY|nr:hypothetical protein TPA0910_86170 [Streptomyces hygroscopicus]
MDRARRTAQGPRSGTPPPQAGGLHPPTHGPPPVRRLRLARDKPHSHIKPKKNRTRFLQFCRYLCSLYSPKIRIAIVLDHFSPHRACSGQAVQRAGNGTAGVQVLWPPPPYDRGEAFSYGRPG